MASAVADEWSALSPDQREVLFTTSVVSHLWHYGNMAAPEKVGCVQCNETIGEAQADFVYREYLDGTPIYWKQAVDMRDYLRASIGCCTDHALFAKVLLTEAGYQAHRVIVPGHWIVQTLVDGTYHTVDATANVMIDRPVEELVAGLPRTAYLCYNDQIAEDWWDFVGKTLGIGLEGSRILSTQDFQYFYDYVNWREHHNTTKPLNNEWEQVF